MRAIAEAEARETMMLILEVRASAFCGGGVLAGWDRKVEGVRMRWVW
jgi:hypothetical protein